MKQDRKLVSKQNHEISYIARLFKMTSAAVRKIASLIGRSRKKLYAKPKENKDLVDPK